jgi:hypothetical protein
MAALIPAYSLQNQENIAVLSVLLVDGVSTQNFVRGGLCQEKLGYIFRINVL